MKKGLFLVGLFAVVSASTFGLLYWRSMTATPGPAVLNLGRGKTGQAVLPLPEGWRVRSYGIDKWGQCAVLVDAASVPRLMVCAFGYPAGSETHPGSPGDAERLAARIAGYQRKPGEQVASATHATGGGTIHEVERTYPSRATYHVVSSGTVSEREFVRTVGPYLLLLRFYGDEAERAALGNVPLELAARAGIRQ